MISVTLYLDLDQVEKLDRLARERDCSRSRLVRLAVDGLPPVLIESKGLSRRPRRRAQVSLRVDQIESLRRFGWSRSRVVRHALRRYL